MKPEKEKMLAGEPYNVLGKQFSTERTEAKLPLRKLNDACADDTETVDKILLELMLNAERVNGCSLLSFVIMATTSKPMIKFFSTSTAWFWP